MQQCKEKSAGMQCNQQCTTFVDKDSPIKMILALTGRINGNYPELTKHFVHTRHHVSSGLCFYHEQIRLGLIDDPNKKRAWRKW